MAKLDQPEDECRDECRCNDAWDERHNRAVEALLRIVESDDALDRVEAARLLWEMAEI